MKKQNRELGGGLITLIVIYMIAGAFGAFFTLVPPEGSDPKLAMMIPFLGLFLSSLALMKFQAMGYFGLILSHVLFAGMYTFYFHDKAFSIDPLEFISVMSTKGVTWMCVFSIVFLWAAVRPIGKYLD